MSTDSTVSTDTTTGLPVPVGATGVLLIVEHRHGVAHTVHPNQESATASLYTFVSTLWPAQGYDLTLGAVPEDREAAIEAYYDNANDEGYEFQAFTVE